MGTAPRRAHSDRQRAQQAAGSDDQRERAAATTGRSSQEDARGGKHPKSGGRGRCAHVPADGFGIDDDRARHDSGRVDHFE